MAKRGGMTMLELLELQARTRAIRAQMLAEPQPANSKSGITDANTGKNRNKCTSAYKKEAIFDCVERCRTQPI